jgi:hypothetical protein
MPFTLLVAVVGQGVGAFLGGCRWIGASVPLGHQVWALVNQPSLSFADQDRALGYWLGSVLLPLIVALTIIHLGARPKSLSAELLALQLAWAGTTVGVAWLPLVDGADGHVARFLYLRELPGELVWLAPLVASAAAALPTLRLLSLARGARRHTGRGLRMGLVVLHLGVPTAAWFGVVSMLEGAVVPAQAIALALPLLTAVTVAFLGYPAAYVHSLREIRGGAFARAVVAGALVAALLWWAGRPVNNDRFGGVLWGTPTELNNIRPWIEAAPALGDDGQGK